MDAMTLDKSVPTDTLWITLDQIDLPPDARPHTQEEIEDMAHELQSADGQLQNIVVVRSGERYEVRAGVCRVLAARFLKWDKIRCLVKEGLSDFDKKRITFAENETRKNPHPLYQAKLLKEMKAEKNLGQEELAVELGKKRDLINKYLMISNLLDATPDFGNRFPKLGLAHLLQISRLKDAKEQLKMAEKATKRDLSVRQLKALVDRSQGKTPKMEGDGVKLEDPLTQVWFYLTKDPDIAPQGGWLVKFGRRHMPDKKEPVDGWNLWLSKPPQTPKAYFKEWLLNLAAAIDTEQDDARAAKLEDEAGPKDEAEFQKLGEESKHVRLPKTEQEQAELEKLAASGPGPVYAWLYGPDSLHAQKAANITWLDMDMPDPVTGCRQLVQGIKARQEFDPEKLTQDMLKAIGTMASGSQGNKG